MFLFRFKNLSLGIFCFISLFTSMYSLAQNNNQKITVTGIVTQDGDRALSGVTVTERGTNNVTFTNETGNYEIRVDPKSVLVFSFVGYQSEEIAVDDRTVINIILKNSIVGLSEVVVVGYGTQKRSSVTGAIDDIGSSSLKDRPVVNTLSALQGTMGNLIIQQTNFEPGQGQNLNIRGISTLGDNTPLIVIDGIPGGSINLINPNDIESVTILKDAGSAAIYGSRSANGVIIITTKSGKKNEKPSVSYSGIMGSQKPRVTYKPVDAWENAYYKNISLVNSGLAPAFSPEQILSFKEQGNGDWRVENILKDAMQQSHNVTLKGGGNNSTFLLSLGAFDQQSNFAGPDYGYKRYNIRLNQTTEIGRLKVNAILSYAKVDNKDHTSSTANLVVDAGRVPLYYNFRDSDGNYLTNAVSAELNPLAILENGGFRKYNNDEIFGSLTAGLEIIEGLKIVGVAGGNITANNAFERQFPLKFLPGGAFGSDSYVGESNFKSLFSNVQARIEFDRSFNSHEVGVMVGATNESYKSESSQIVERFTDPDLGVPITGTVIDPANTKTSINGTSETSINSLFGRATYNFSGRYFLEFDFRYDGSSKFAKENRWGFFPSVSAAWSISKESFFERITDVISSLKIRGSYGILGNQNVAAYQYQTTYHAYSNAYAFNNTIVSGSGFSTGNPDLTWEKAATADVGIDATLFSRIGVNFDYYHKITSGILAPRDDIPDIFGAAFPNFNIARVKNRGWELKLSYGQSIGNFNHRFSFNLADNLNEIMDLSAGVSEYSPYQKEEFQILRRVGQPITVYYGYKTRGIFQNMDQVNDDKSYPRFANSIVGPGDLIYVDRNGDGVINDADKFILGNPFPRYTFGFTYNASWKNIDVEIFIQGVGKRDQMIRGEQVEPFHFGYGGTVYEHQTDFWNPTNPNAKWPRLAEAGSTANSNNYRIGSDLYLFDAAYARLKNVQIGYSLPSTVLNKVGIKNVRIYLTGQNLVTLSKLNFLDPENTEFNNNTSTGAGANSARSYFMPKFYGAGLDITF